MTAPGCNRCGDGFNMPPDCGRSPAEVEVCRARIARQIAAHYHAYRLRVDRPAAIAELANLANDQERRERLDGLKLSGIEPAALAALRREVYDHMLRHGLASPPERNEQAVLL